VATSYGFLSTYPPTQCGLATFTAALCRALTLPGHDARVGVVRVVDAKVYTARPYVVGHLRAGDPGGPIAAAAALNEYDVAIVQHEYGIYGGLDGDEVLSVLDHVRVPVISVLHTVLTRPTPHQRSVLEAVTARAEAVVVLSDTARARLVSGYDVDTAKVTVIPHGAAEIAEHVTAGGRRPTILTWGLLGPGKGIEWALAAMRGLRRLQPLPQYIIAGQTHPRVLAREGEAYRLGLVTRIRALGIDGLVRFERGYLDEPVLRRLIARADIVLLPYDSNEQVTSGVLIEAVAAHKPVVSTAFPHAVELLAGGAGIVVPHRNAAAIGDALLRVLTEPGLAAHMSRAAAQLAPAVRWPTVADRYRSLAGQLLSDGLLATR
jgi:glycosyltransferase involved in cell wall biosynthesis